MLGVFTNGIIYKMEKITNDIIAKVISSYLGVKIDLSNTEWYKLEMMERGRFIEATLSGINSNENSVGACIQHNIKTQNNGLQWLSFSAFKLILKPLSSITDEDAIEVGKILFGKEYSVGEVDRRNDYEVSVKVLKPDTTINQNVYIGFKGGLSNCNGWGLQNMLQAYQYLQSKGYDLPQHLLGGKTLQEAELAIYEK